VVRSSEGCILSEVIKQGRFLEVHKDDPEDVVGRYHRRLRLSPGTTERGPVHLAVSIDLMNQPPAGDPEHRPQIGAGLVLTPKEARAVVTHLQSLLETAASAEPAVAEPSTERARERSAARPVAARSASSPQALLDDPAWVLARYAEAKDLLNDLREEFVIARQDVPAELRERLEEFHEVTYLDTCTTLGPDCGCNSPKDDR
jgi:hypothetical protein